ncbi:MAG TPA: BREX system ATP-binding domain-containing protein [Candidatus Nitrosocosmicus sp.]|nr:BREX system ATP-binding domain-containing protein [Candidatus Nitrosocosmicus sp.]
MELTTQRAGQIINALKNGVVPDEDLELLCVGRDREIREFERCFEITAGGSGTVKFLNGEYGSGKSFLINVIKQKAVRSNFIVSRIQVDRGFRFNNLEHLYYHVMHNLTLNVTGKAVTSFESIFDLWIAKLQEASDPTKAAAEINEVITSLNRYNMSFARAFLAYIKARVGKNRVLSDAIASWLMGEKNIPANIKAKFDVIGAVDRLNSIDFLKAFVELVKLLGYRGLVILIDELELVMSERVDIRRVSYENLRNMVDLCCSGELGSCMFVFAATNEFFDNPEKGIKTYEALAQRLGDAIDKSNSALCDVRQPIMRLQKLSVEEFQELTDRVIDIYKMLYNFEPTTSNESIRSWTFISCKKFGAKISELSVREYLTKLIEVLDIMEQHPENKVFTSELKAVRKGDTEVYINNSSKA